MTLPWEPQPGESSTAFAAFACYRDLGSERSLEAVGRSLGKSRVLMERWSTKFAWVARALAYDAHLDALSRKKREAEILKVRERHAKLGAAMQGVAVAGLRRKQRKANEQDGELDMAPQEIARLAADGAKIESAALGIPTDVTETQDGGKPPPAPIPPPPDASRVAGILRALARAGKIDSTMIGGNGHAGGNGNGRAVEEPDGLDNLGG